jgi:hypothetical protein
VTAILWVGAAGALASLLAFGGGTVLGMGLGQDREFAKRAREESIVAKVSEQAQQGAANAIAALKPVNKTIVQKTQREITENVVYRDCRVPADGMRLANEAITGQRPQPAGDKQLP